MYIKGLDKAEQFVHDQLQKGIDIRWVGWDIVIWKPTHYGYDSPLGAFRRNRWGVEFKSSPDKNGGWAINPKHVNNTRAVRA